MNYAELVKQVADNLNMAAGAKEFDIVNEVFQVIKAKVAEGEKVEIRNFGTFDIVNKSERKGRNPQTGDSIIIPAKKPRDLNQVRLSRKC